MLGYAWNTLWWLSLPLLMALFCVICISAWSLSVAVIGFVEIGVRVREIIRGGSMRAIDMPPDARERYRAECEARHVGKLPPDRKAVYLARVLLKRGKEEYRKLYEAVQRQ
jgi:hypothetical protein